MDPPPSPRPSARDARLVARFAQHPAGKALAFRVRNGAILTLLFALIAIALLFPRDRKPTEKRDAAGAATTVYGRVCQQCHGAAGEGNVALQTPSIAGQPEWYLRYQLQKFRLGHRGTAPGDTFGQQMRAVALTLEADEINEVVDTVISFEPNATESTFEADVANGRLIYEEQCIDCHRYNASGEKVFGSSPLTAFQDWYIAAQIEKFRSGVRGYHPDDEKGQQMRHLIGYLSEEDCRDVSGYIATLAKRYPPKLVRKRSR